MKVVLQNDVRKVGKRYDVVDVSDGHALNFLIPQGLAVEATAKAVAKAKNEKKNAETGKQISESLLEKNLNVLKGKEITINAKASEKGHLFASVDAEMISSAIVAQTGQLVHPDFIKLTHHLKEVGDHEIEISTGKAKANVIVKVQAV